MKFSIEYALCCNKGKLRRKNQDNFFCEGDFLPVENNGFEGIKSGKITSDGKNVLAVFDGMGGEQMGEYASYIAASALKELTEGRITPDEMTLEEYCLEINRRICTFAKENGIRSMGTTGCLISFSEDHISLCNIGDSKIYYCYDNKMIQRSYDHVIKMGSGKAPLTQFLGIPEEEFRIQPHKDAERYRTGDVYLICSDGLTDMVEPESIRSVLISGRSIEECVQTLLMMALEGGGRDNITILLCRVKGRKLF